MPAHPHQDVSEVPPLSPAAQSRLDAIVSGFNLEAATRVKAIEATTNHDVKAVEYFLKEAFASEWSGERRRPFSTRLHCALQCMRRSPILCLTPLYFIFSLL